MVDGEDSHSCSDGEDHHDDEEDLHESMRDAADEFEERVMRAIERNIRRTISENDVAIDMYDNDTVLVQQQSGLWVRYSDMVYVKQNFPGL